VVRVWTRAEIGYETGDHGWEILDATEDPELLRYATGEWPDGTFESKVVKCTWPASEDEERLRKTIQRLGMRALNHWNALIRPLDAGFLEIDNGASERALKPVALGRKNSYDRLSRPGAQRDRRCSMVLIRRPAEGATEPRDSTVDQTLIRGLVAP
jgi:hypothetical protein